MKLVRPMFIVLVVAAALCHRSDGRQQRPAAEQLRLAGITPRGAMLYVQSSDLSRLMRTWLASPVRDRLYKSSSFRAFSRSHVYLKLLDRRKDFENAIGFALDENRLAALAGGYSALAVYDVSKLEVVFVTEIGRERVVAAGLLREVRRFEERGADGLAYYVREVATDGGRLSQQFCFAYASGKLIVTTTEGLMIRSLSNIKAADTDSLLADIMETSRDAEGFTANDVTMWVDQGRLNQNRLFNSYWIHGNIRQARNGPPLSSIETGIVDLQVTGDGLNERRWFRTAGSSEDQRAPLTPERLGGLLRFAPAGSHLVEARGNAHNGRSLAESVSRIFFGRLPEPGRSAPDIPDFTRATQTEGSRPLTGRYSRLDARFDRETDDEQAPGVRAPVSRSPSRSQDDTEYISRIEAVLDPVSSPAYCEMVMSTAGSDRPFVGFERAVVVEMGAEDRFDRSMFERAVTDEAARRFVVGGVDPGFAWQDEGRVRFLAQSLLDQGAAYSVTGNYLVIGSSIQYVLDILSAAAGPSVFPSAQATTDFYGFLRVAAARPAFDQLMSKLDGRIVENDSRSGGDEDSNTEVMFFSDNLSSLAAAFSIRDVRIERERGDGFVRERIAYAW